jgi:hypothetical protein
MVVDPDGRKLDPCHASVYYLNEITRQCICVHVYYNAFGNSDLKSIQAKLIEPDGSVIPIELTGIQKEYSLIQTQPTQQLLLVFLREKKCTQDNLLNDVRQLEDQLSEQYGKPESQPILELLSNIMRQSIRYSGVWDARLDFYELYLHNLRTKPKDEDAKSCVDTPEDAPTRVIGKKSSSRSKKKSASNKAVPQKNQRFIEIIRAFLDEWLLDAAPCDGLDDAQCITWIAQYQQYFMRLDTLCRFSGLTLGDEPSMQTQWQRLPTKGPLFAYFETHLFLGHATIARALAPLIPETQALVDLYERFLRAIEQDKVLHKERIETAHVLYECSPTYLQVVTAKKYQLKIMELSKTERFFYGIVFELFMNNDYDVFCMYADQGLADATNLQLLFGENLVPHHSLGAILGLSLLNREAPRYLEKLMSSCSHVIWPHLLEVDFGLYSINGHKLQKRGLAYTFMSRDGTMKFVPADTSVHHSLTTLRYALQVYTNAFRKGGVKSNVLSSYPQLIATLLRYGDISCEQLIKETMRFFNNSFFTTNYIMPCQQRIYPTIPLFSNLNEGAMCADEIGRTDEKSRSITVLFGLCPESPGQMELRESAGDIAGQLLSTCLETFNSCAPQAQHSIVDNLYQLAVLALKKNDLHECVYLTKALLFSCISAKAPSLEVHEIFIKANALSITTQTKLFSLGSQSSALLGVIKNVPGAYLNGLSEEVVEQLRARNPAMINKIIPSVSRAVEVAQDFVAEERTRSLSPPLSEGPNLWQNSAQSMDNSVPIPGSGGALNP